MARSSTIAHPIAHPYTEAKATHALKTPYATLNVCAECATQHRYQVTTITELPPDTDKPCQCEHDSHF